MKNNLPKVTIGMPVYNGAEYIRDTLESLQRQTFQNFLVLISDNLSTDNTRSICSEFFEKDERFKYKCHETNLGSEANFKYILDQVDSEYFMFLGHDDWLSDNFLELCIDYLDCNGDTSITSGVPLYYDNTRFKGKGVIHNHSQNNAGLRIMDYYYKVKDNGIFYGLMRMDMVDKKTFRNIHSASGEFASDHHWVATLILKGKSKVFKNCTIHREVGLNSMEHGSSISSRLIINQAHLYLKTVFYFSKKMLEEKTIGILSFLGIFIIIISRWYVKRFLGIKQFQIRKWFKKAFFSQFSN
jgi:glycosyltransferase involved in cell wall biosynthesis